MESLGALLLKYKTLTATDEVTKRALISAIRDVCDIEVPQSAITVGKNTITMVIHPIERKQVLENKERISALLKREGVTGSLI